MISLNKDTFHGDECEYIFDCEDISLEDAIYTFCQDISTNPVFENEMGIGLINVMSKEENSNRDPFGLQYCTIYDNENPAREFRFVDRGEGTSLIPDNVLCMRVVYLQKLRQNKKTNSYKLNIVVDGNRILETQQNNIE